MARSRQKRQIVIRDAQTDEVPRSELPRQPAGGIFSNDPINELAPYNDRRRLSGVWRGDTRRTAQETNSSRAQQREETKSLDALYQDALAEGGNLVVYAGGDTPTQQDAAKNAFLAQFPKN